MIDALGRNIEYLRLSVTDRCNLRCRYCMPQDGIDCVSHDEVLRYEEYLRLVRLFAKLGIRHVRVTGGEPLVRRGITDFVAALASIDGIDTVSMTTNGVLLSDTAAALKAAGLDSINISLDTTDEALAAPLTGRTGTVDAVLHGIDAALQAGIPIKLNAVLLRETEQTLTDLLTFAERGIPVRFIELMPMGYGKQTDGIPAEEALALLRTRCPDLHPIDKKLGSGPAHYYASDSLKAPIGIIDAVSTRFCDSCNRVRLTSTGILKPCLCFDTGIALGTLLRSGATDTELLETIERCIYEKPRQHCFDAPEAITEKKHMSEIGG